MPEQLIAGNPVTGDRMVVGHDRLRAAVAQRLGLRGAEGMMGVLRALGVTLEQFQQALTQQSNRRERTMRKSEYIMALVADDIQYPPAVISTLKAFKKAHKFNSPLPFEQATALRFAAMQVMVATFARAYQVDPPTLEMANIVPGDADSSASFYNPEEHKILLTGKLSVITFLHEFAHALGYDEEQARKWSLTLFKKVYPVAFEKLVMGPGAGPTDFFLVRETLSAATVVGNGHVASLESGPVVDVLPDARGVIQEALPAPAVRSSETGEQMG